MLCEQTTLPASPKQAQVHASPEMARPRLELGTPRFSGTGNWCRKRQKRPANRRVDDCVCSTLIPVDCCSYPRLKDVAGPPRPFRLLRATAASGSNASATPALARAAPPLVRFAPKLRYRLLLSDAHVDARSRPLRRAPCRSGTASDDVRRGAPKAALPPHAAEQAPRFGCGPLRVHCSPMYVPIGLECCQA
jgi:hypothetical protein